MLTQTNKNGKHSINSLEIANIDSWLIHSPSAWRSIDDLCISHVFAGLVERRFVLNIPTNPYCVKKKYIEEATSSQAAGQIHRQIYRCDSTATSKSAANISQRQSKRCCLQLPVVWSISVVLLSSNLTSRTCNETWILIKTTVALSFFLVLPYSGWRLSPSRCFTTLSLSSDVQSFGR